MSRWNRVGQLYRRLFQEGNEEGVEEAWPAQVTRSAGTSCLGRAKCSGKWRGSALRRHGISVVGARPSA